MTTIAPDLAFLNSPSFVLKRGNHPGQKPPCDGGECCALEAINWARTMADRSDAVRDDEPRFFAALPNINDGPWRDDEHRTTTLRPYLVRIAALVRDDEKDEAVRWALADYAIRTVAPETLRSAADALETAKVERHPAILRKHADKLAALPVVTSENAAAAAAARYAAAAAAAAAAADAAARYAAAAAARYAAGAAARYAADAAARYAADAAAARSKTWERHVCAILDICCAVYGPSAPFAFFAFTASPETPR